MSEAIKMADVFNLPLEANSLDISNALGEVVGDFSTEEQDSAAVHAINNHDKLTQQVKDLEFSLDDRDCYIADADMKNEALTKQVAELRAALSECRKYIVCDVNNRLKPHNPSCLVGLADKALKEGE